ncbi:MAG: hypothetical protein RL748_1899 [Pseudomonadota bacterium]|jgi:CubicO group peptidase (beta-lactamase class C family)
MRLIYSTLALALLSIGPARADKIDDVIQAEMQRRQIPGLSLAIVDGGKIVKVKSYGVIEKGSKKAVTPQTLFQAGSVSKPVAALALLHLVDQGKLSLDEDVNLKLKSWKVPESEYTQQKKTSLRTILSHSAGLTVHGFGGYAKGTPVPTLVQVLNGTPPANSAAVVVNIYPGKQTRYSGGGYTVAQQLAQDVSGQSFPDLMQSSVLGPLGMTHSTYQQPLPADKHALAATGHDNTRRKVAGDWHTYPEMAAAGLWTTPTDLAKMALGMQAMLHPRVNGKAKNKPVLSGSMAQQMLTPQSEQAGLGFFLKPPQEFGHGGRNEGFDTQFTATRDTGQAAVIMINTNDNSGMMSRIIAAISSQYRWPGSSAPAASKGAQVKLADAVLDRYNGYYEVGDGNLLPLARNGSQLQTYADGLPDESFTALSELRFVASSGQSELSFVPDNKQQGMVLIQNARGHNQKMDRISPLLKSLKPKAEQASARSEGIKATLLALAQGGPAISQAPLLAPNAKTDFKGATMSEFANLTGLSLLYEADVHLTRHNTLVSKILGCKMQLSKPAAGNGEFVLVYLTAEGLLADLDVVSE